MRRRTRFCLCLAAAALIGPSSQACSPGPGPYFARPSYIDPDYKTLGYSDYGYGRRTTFGMILRQYVTLDTAQGGAGDIDARAVSAAEEPDAYASYQVAALYFRNEYYESALAIFTELKRTAEPSPISSRPAGEKRYSWVREASSYMIARSQLILAQRKFDGYWDPARSVDQKMLFAAHTAYLEYLKEYPNGLYASSARNIRRKIYYLSGQQSLLNEELRQAMLEQFPASAAFTRGRFVNKNLVEEFETYFQAIIDFAHDSPMLLAYAWLGTYEPNPQEMIALESREKDFSAYPGLFNYVRALGLYKMGRYQELLEKTAEGSPEDTTLWLSTQLLRARAHTKLGDYREALSILEQMHAVSGEDAVDVEIATLQLNNGYGLLLYTEASPVTSEKNLAAFALFGLTDKELELGISKHQISVSKRQILVDELARRYILSGRFKELTRLLDQEQLPIFSPIKTTASSLASNPRDVEALADMGEFLYVNYVTPRSMFAGYDKNLWMGDPLAGLSPRCEPCAGFKERTAQYTPPIAFFLSAVEISRQSKKKSESEAKALHYIVRGGRSGYSWSNRCTWTWTWGDDAAFARSKNAFVRLHKLYKNSPWAAATPYYYR